MYVHVPLCVLGISRSQESSSGSLKEQQVLLTSEPPFRLSLLTSPWWAWRTLGTHSHHWPGVHSLPSGAHFPGSQPEPCRSGWRQFQPGVEKHVRAAGGGGPSLLTSRSLESRLSKTHRTRQRGKERKRFSSKMALSGHVPVRVLVEKDGKA